MKRITYKKTENGLEFVSEEEFDDADLPTEEELIAEKENQLLALYEEIQKLKENKG